MLADLTPEEQEDLRARGRTRRYKRGTVLYHQGDDSDWVVLLERGRVKVSSATEDGHQAVLAVLSPGELVGELSTFDGEPRSATVTAVDDVEAVVVTAPEFRAFLEDHPSVALTLLETVGRRLRDADRIRLEFGGFDIEARVARRLIDLADRFGEGETGVVRISLPFSQEELAAWVGASREAVSKALGVFRARGWLETNRRQLTVLDLAALRQRGRGR